MSADMQAVISFRTPKNTLLTVIKAGIAKAQNAWWMTFLMGTIAGCYLAFGGLLSLAIAGGFYGPGSLGETNPGLPKLIQAATFPVGLMMVILAGSELFTGNCMFLILPLIERKITFKDFCKNWFWSYLGNFIGSVLIAFFLGYLTEVVATGGPHSLTVAIGAKKSLGGWGATFLKAIGANWLVCMSLFMAISSDATIGKIVCLWWPIFAFVAMGFEHSIANMFYVPMALMEQTRDPTSKFNFGDFIAFNLIPVTLGNILGGSFFMAVLEWILYRDHFAGKVETMQPVPGAQRQDKDKESVRSSKLGRGPIQVVLASPESPLAHTLAQHFSSPAVAHQLAQQFSARSHHLGPQPSFPSTSYPVPLVQQALLQAQLAQQQQQQQQPQSAPAQPNPQPTVQFSIPDGAVAVEMEPPKI